MDRMKKEIDQLSKALKKKVTASDGQPAGAGRTQQAAAVGAGRTQPAADAATKASPGRSQANRERDFWCCQSCGFGKNYHSKIICYNCDKPKPAPGLEAESVAAVRAAEAAEVAAREADQAAAARSAAAAAAAKAAAQAEVKRQAAEQAKEQAAELMEEADPAKGEVAELEALVKGFLTMKGTLAWGRVQKEWEAAEKHLKAAKEKQQSRRSLPARFQAAEEKKTQISARLTELREQMEGARLWLEQLEGQHLEVQAQEQEADAEIAALKIECGTGARPHSEEQMKVALLATAAQLEGRLGGGPQVQALLVETFEALFAKFHPPGGAATGAAEVEAAMPVAVQQGLVAAPPLASPPGSQTSASLPSTAAGAGARNGLAFGPASTKGQPLLTEWGQTALARTQEELTRAQAALEQQEKELLNIANEVALREAGGVHISAETAAEIMQLKAEGQVKQEERDFQQGVVAVIVDRYEGMLKPKGAGWTTARPGGPYSQ